ncbi:Dpy-30 motif family protein [Histomonas meleagridis]|nr:Dpy-30 motif family protein [Histomonas meleagridis]
MEEEKPASDYKIFVNNCDSYIGSAVSNFLSLAGFTVFGYGKSAPNPNIHLVSSRKEGILSTMLSVFDMVEDTKSVEEALDIVNSNPLHHKISLVIFSTLLTWGGRVKKEKNNEEEEESHENEEENDEPNPEDYILEEGYLTRIPHKAAKKQYLLESRALQVNEEIDRLKVYIFGVGLLYGYGEHIFFPFFFFFLGE